MGGLSSPVALVSAVTASVADCLRPCAAGPAAVGGIDVLANFSDAATNDAVCVAAARATAAVEGPRTSTGMRAGIVTALRRRRLAVVWASRRAAIRFVMTYPKWVALKAPDLHDGRQGNGLRRHMCGVKLR